MKMLIACALAYGVTHLLTPVSMGLARRIGAVDIPRDWRRMHQNAVPRAGGTAIVFGLLIAFTVLGYGESNRFALGVGCIGLCVMGLIDDVLCLGAGIKLLVQAGIVVGTVWASGMRGGFAVAGVLWVLTLVNAHNMIDGLDGLLTGCVAIEGSALSVVLLMLGFPNSDIAALVVLACLGFLPYNRHPAKTFAGDCGSESLGFLMGILSLPLLRAFHGIGAFTPIFLFAYPLTDLGAAISRRLLRGKSPFCADRGHLHHRIFDAGVDHEGCTAVLLTLTGALCVTGVFICNPRLWGAAAVACLLSAGLLVCLRGYVLKKS